MSDLTKKLKKLGIKAVPSKTRQMTRAELKSERVRRQEVATFLRKLDAAEKRAGRSKLIIGGPNCSCRKKP